MLDFLISPISRETFFAQYWERCPLHIPRPRPDWCASLPSVEDVDAILDAGPLDDVRLVQTQAGLATEMTGRGSGPRDVETIYQAYADGWTIVLNGLHRRVAAVARVARQLDAALHHDVGVNLYVTPAKAQGFAPHMDGHDVFVLQTSGAKRWRVYPAPVELPLEEHEARIDPDSPGRCLLTATLEPGHVLYIPRGFVHEGESVGGSSVHLTLGVHPVRWVDLLKEAVQVAAERDVRFRQSVALDGSGGAPTALADDLRVLLRELATQGVETEAVARTSHRRIRASRAAPDGHFASIDRAGTLGLDSIVEVRPGMTAMTRVAGGRAGIEFGRNAVYGPAGLEAALRFVEATPRFRVSSLPGHLSDNSKLVLVRRLVHEGLLRVPEGGTDGQSQGSRGKSRHADEGRARRSRPKHPTPAEGDAQPEARQAARAQHTRPGTRT